MILVLLGISIIVLIAGRILNRFEPFDAEFTEACDFISLLGILGIVGSIATILILAVSLSQGKIDNEKIAMYTEENTKIEAKVKETVRVYMDYEEKTYKNLVKNADLTTLLVKYPELNSNSLVKEEIKIYKENSKSIKKLKENQISRKVCRWWLYFGN